MTSIIESLIIKPLIESHLAAIEQAEALLLSKKVQLQQLYDLQLKLERRRPILEQPALEIIEPLPMLEIPALCTRKTCFACTEHPIMSILHEESYWEKTVPISPVVPVVAEVVELVEAEVAEVVEPVIAEVVELVEPVEAEVAEVPETESPSADSTHSGSFSVREKIMSKMVEGETLRVKYQRVFIADGTFRFDGSKKKGYFITDKATGETYDTFSKWSLATKNAHIQHYNETKKPISPRLLIHSDNGKLCVFAKRGAKRIAVKELLA